MSNDTRIGVDVAKAVFELAISDRPGHVIRRERLPRGQFLAFMAQQPEATVVMEAYGSAHHWGRKIQALGHRVVLLPPHAFVPTSAATRRTAQTPRASWRRAATRISGLYPSRRWTSRSSPRSIVCVRAG